MVAKILALGVNHAGMSACLSKYSCQAKIKSSIDTEQAVNRERRQSHRGRVVHMGTAMAKFIACNEKENLPHSCLGTLLTQLMPVSCKLSRCQWPVGKKREIMGVTQ